MVALVILLANRPTIVWLFFPHACPDDLSYNYYASNFPDDTPDDSPGDSLRILLTILLTMLTIVLRIL